MPPLKERKTFTPQPIPEYNPMLSALIAVTEDRRVLSCNHELKPEAIEYVKKNSIDDTKARDVFIT